MTLAQARAKELLGWIVLVDFYVQENHNKIEILGPFLTLHEAQERQLGVDAVRFLYRGNLTMHKPTILQPLASDTQVPANLDTLPR
jgi:hypothetical protein